MQTPHRVYPASISPSIIAARTTLDVAYSSLSDNSGPEGQSKGSFFGKQNIRIVLHQIAPDTEVAGQSWIRLQPYLATDLVAFLNRRGYQD